MSEMSMELLQIARESRDRTYEETGGRATFEGVPEYDKGYWRGVDGVVRELYDMDTMHLALVYKQLEIGKGRLYADRKYFFQQELNRRGFDKEDWEINLVGIALGLYCFYPDEDSHNLEEYYQDLLHPYFMDNHVDFPCPDFMK